MDRTPPPTGRAVAQHIISVVGGVPKVLRAFDADETHWVDLAKLPDRPSASLVTCSTLTLHVTRNEVNGRNIPVELVGVTNGQPDDFANLVGTAAFYIMKDGWVAAP